MNENRIAVWLAEEEVGGGLPPERAYKHSHFGSPIGWVVLPDGILIERYAEFVSLAQAGPPGGYSAHVASLGSRRFVEAAIAGEFGLSFVRNETWKPADFEAEETPE
jgi:hypothetical protein